MRPLCLVTEDEAVCIWCQDHGDQLQGHGDKVKFRERSRRMLQSGLLHGKFVSISAGSSFNTLLTGICPILSITVPCFHFEVDLPSIESRRWHCSCGTDAEADVFLRKVCPLQHFKSDTHESGSNFYFLPTHPLQRKRGESERGRNPSVTEHWSLSECTLYIGHCQSVHCTL